MEEGEPTSKGGNSAGHWQEAGGSQAAGQAPWLWALVGPFTTWVGKSPLDVQGRGPARDPGELCGPVTASPFPFPGLSHFDQQFWDDARLQRLLAVGSSAD